MGTNLSVSKVHDVPKRLVVNGPITFCSPLYKKNTDFPSQDTSEIWDSNKKVICKSMTINWPSNHNWCCDSMHFPTCPQSFQPPIALRDSKNCVAWTTTSMGFWHIWRSDWLDCCRICGPPKTCMMFFFLWHHESSMSMKHLDTYTSFFYDVLLQLSSFSNKTGRINWSTNLLNCFPYFPAGLQKSSLLNLHRSSVSWSGCTCGTTTLHLPENKEGMENPSDSISHTSNLLS